MIIIEGPDNSGKSTLCDYLSKGLSLPVIHSGGPAKDFASVQIRQEGILREGKIPRIYDRMPMISDPIYRFAFNEPSFFYGYKLDSYLKWLKRIDPLIIVCKPPEEIMANLETHQKSEYDSEEHIITQEIQDLVISLYSNFYTNHLENKFQSFQYDYTKDNKLTVLKACINHLQK